MKRLEVRNLFSPDVEIDVWEPTSNAVWALLQFEVGTEGEKEADTFDVMIATPEGLKDLAKPDASGVLSSRNTIVLREFSWSAVRAALLRIIHGCDSPSWTESVIRLQRYFHWEYEDFVQEK